jgi:anti-sigma factor RsiW
MNCSTYRTLVTDDIDGRLDALARIEVERHLAACAACARLRREQGEVKDLLHVHRLRVTVPADVRARVLAALDDEPRPRLLASRRRWLLVGAIAALALLTLLPRGRQSKPDLVASLAHDVQLANAGEVRLALRTDDPEALRRFFRAGGIQFEKTVPDLRPLGLHQIGGLVDEVDGVPATLTIFDGPFGKVVCRRFAAGSIPLPEGGRTVGDSTVYSRDGVTMRILRDGDAICILAAAMSEEEFVRALVERT